MEPDSLPGHPCQLPRYLEVPGNPGHFPVLQGSLRNSLTFCIGLVRNVLRKFQTMRIVLEYPGFKDIRV